MQDLWILAKAPVNDIILALGIQKAGFLFEQIGKKLKNDFLVEFNFELWLKLEVRQNLEI